METCNVVSLTFESVDEILWCDHSNEISSAVLLYGTICFLIFNKMKFSLFTVEFLFSALLGVKGLKYNNINVNYRRPVTRSFPKTSDYHRKNCKVILKAKSSARLPQLRNHPQGFHR